MGLITVLYGKALQTPAIFWGRVSTGAGKRSGRRRRFREPVGSETVWVPWVVTEAEREPSTLLTWSFRMEVRFNDEPFFLSSRGGVLFCIFILR